MTNSTNSDSPKGKLVRGSSAAAPDIFRFEKPTIMRNVVMGELDIDAASYLPASETALGLIKVGNNLSIREDGTLDAASGPGGGIATIKEGAGIGVDATDPNNPVVSVDVATEDSLGGIKVGNNLSIRPDGTLDAASGPGGGIATIKPGAGIGVDATDPNNPVVSTDIATETTLGAIKVGKNLTIDADGTLDAEGGGGVVDKIEAGPGVTIDATTPSSPEIGVVPATSATIGGIKVGKNLTIAADGTLDAQGGSAITPATKTTLGGVIVGDGLAVAADGTLSSLGSAVNVKVLKGTDRTYTVKATDFDLTIITVENTDPVSIFLDSKIQYTVGAKIKIMTAAPTLTQVVPLGDTVLNTGGLLQRGRSIVVAVSEETKNSPGFGDLVYAGGNTWVFRAPQLQVGAPWMEYAGQVDGKWSSGQIQVKCNTAGEDLSKVIAWNVVGTPITKDKANPPLLKRVDKNTRTIVLGASDQVVKGGGYFMKTQYVYFENGQERLIDSVSPQGIVTADKDTPSYPQNLRVLGFRGARCFIDFDYDSVKNAPWNGYEARAYDAQGNLVTDWVAQDIVPDKDPNKPWRFIQFWPTYQKVVGNGCKVDFRLTNGSRAMSGKGDAVSITVNWDANLIVPVMQPITTDRTLATITWNLVDGTYNDPDCNWKLNIYEGSTLKSENTYAWNDNSGGYAGNINTTYTAVLTANTYGRVGPETRQDFRIQSPF